MHCQLTKNFWNWVLLVSPSSLPRANGVFGDMFSIAGRCRVLRHLAHVSGCDTRAKITNVFCYHYKFANNAPWVIAERLS